MKNNKGFTLVELLATIVIMGLITTIITPSVINLQKSNKKKKFESYEKVLVSASKIFVQREGEDITSLGVSDWVGCVDITYQDLLTSKLIKPFEDSDYDCSNSKVRLSRSLNGDTYTYNLVCNSTNSKKENYSSVNIENNQCVVNLSS